MPREQINYADTKVLHQASHLSPTGEPVIKADTEVSVLWLRGDTGDDGWVQIALDADVSYLKFAAENENGSAPGRSQVTSAVLTRRELNHLVRTLQRARNAAYEADE